MTINSPDKILLIVFDGVLGQTVNLNLTNVTISKSFVSIYNPDGSLLIQPTLVTTSGGALQQTLPTTGTYTIVVDPHGQITTVAGTGTFGFSGDGGPATGAQIAHAEGIAVDPQGNLFFADRTNNRVRKVAFDGVITTVAGTGTFGFSGDGGPAISAALRWPNDVAVDSLGNVFIADTNNHRIRKVALNGTITTIAGTGTAGYNGDNISATTANLNYPGGVAVDTAGNVFVSDRNNHRIRKISTAGIITTVAGTGTSGYNGDNILATTARLNQPARVTVEAQGNLFISENLGMRIRRVDTNGIITTVAGDGTGGSGGDWGPATSAQILYPVGIALDSDGNLLITDSSHRVRKVRTDGVIITIAGNGVLGYGGDNGPGTLAAFYSPSAAVDDEGNLFISDSQNFRIRKVMPPSSSGAMTLTLTNP